MRITILIAAVASSLMSLHGYAEQAEPDKALQTAPRDAAALRSEKEKLSYALGMNLGNEIRGQSMEVDLDALVRGIRDARSGKTLLTKKEALAAINAFRSDLKRKQTASNSDQGARNTKEGEAFLAENKIKDGVVSLPSGLQYRILKTGEGEKPAIDDTVVVQYRGTFIDGSEFASSYRTKKPATLALRKAFKGWSEALQLMPVGSKWELFVPSHLAYGERGSRGRIGPNATLIFELELLSVKENVAAKTPAAPALAGITFSFKLDSRLTQGSYMGERWVSPPTYTEVQAGENLIVIARADGRNAKGEAIEIRSQWRSEDPEMVMVAPDKGSEVKITVLRPGESVLEVASQGLSRKLLVKAEYQNNVLVGSFTGETP